VCFITGEPIVFEGTLTIRKTLRQDKTTGKKCDYGKLHIQPQES